MMDEFTLENPFEKDSNSCTANTILFPEVHLNSPIVLNQLRLICHIAEIPAGFDLRDTTILHNHDSADEQQRKKRNGPLYQSARHIKDVAHRILKTSQCIDAYKIHKDLIRIKDTVIGHDAKILWKQAVHHMDCFQKNDKKFIDELFHNLDHVEGRSTRHDWNEISPLFKSSKYRDSVNVWYKIRHVMREVQNSRGSAGKNGYNLVKIIKGGTWNCYINGAWVCLHNKSSNTHCFLSPNQVLMYNDLVEGRWLALLGASLQDALPRLDDCLNWFLSFFDRFFTCLGRDTFDIIELIEAFLIGAIQCQDDSPSLRGHFLADTLYSFREILEDNMFQDIDTIIEQLRTFLTDHDVEVYAELFCAFRLWGHPPVEASPAAQKMREYMNAPAYTSMRSLLKNQRAFRVMLINGYIRQNGGTWPNVELDPSRAPKLLTLRMTGKGIPLEDIDSLANEIDTIHFQKTFDIDLENDFSIYFKDKAIAPTVDHWDSTYQWSSMQYVPKIYHGHRRLLSYFLDDKEFDPYTYLEYVESREYLDDPTFNASTSLKEREVKLNGRLFAKMTPKMRGGQVIAESLLSKHIMPLLQENGMVRTERDISQSLIAMNLISTGESANSESFFNLAGFLTTDIKKYCQSQRYEISALIADDLNKLFGLRELFHWQHKILMEHDIYVADPFCPPGNATYIPLSALDDPIKVEKCSGGIEGLSQKLWSIMSITMIRDVAREMGCKILALVCGDNQVIAVTKRYPPSVHISDAREDIVKVVKDYHTNLAKRLSEVNQLLKDRETVLSSNIIIFGKRVLRNGRYLPQSLKAMTRMALWAETTVEETRSACSNLATVVSKALSQGANPKTMYFLHAIRVVEQILHGIHMTLNKGLENLKTDGILEIPNFLALISRLPSHLGGFNYLLRDRLIVRNIGDPLSVSFADLKGLLKAGFMTQSVFNRIVNQKPGNGQWLQLGLDPYSGNIQSTQSMTTILERITSSSILATSVNPLLQGLFHDKYQEEDETTAKKLLDVNRPTPRWASAILGLLPTGKRKKIAGYVETMKTTIRQACDRGGLTTELRDRLINYDRDQFILIISVVLDDRCDLEVPMACAVTLAENFRKRCWSHLLSGRKLEGLETPPIVEIFRGHLLKDGDSCPLCLLGKGSFGWAQIRAGSSILNNQRPVKTSVTPYMGSDTQERSQVSLLRPWRPSAPVKEAIRLAMLVIWRYGETERSWELAEKLASTRIFVDKRVFKAVVPSPAAANMNHRLNDGDTQVTHFTGRDPRFSRHIRLSTDRLNDLLEGAEDTNFVFQPAMLTCIATLEDELRYTTQTAADLTYHLHVETTCCIREVPNAIDPEVPDIDLSTHTDTLRTNPLIYDPQGVQFSPLTDQDSLTEIKSPALTAKTQSNQSLTRGLGVCVGTYVGKGITGLAKMAALGENWTDTEGSLTVTGLISEISTADARSVLFSLATTLLLDSASDLYFSRIRGVAEMVSWWASRLAISPHKIWLPLKSVFNSRKVLTRWLEDGIFIPAGSPNFYNSISIETIHRWIINAIEHMLKNPDVLLNHLVVADSKLEVQELKKDLVMREIWMIGALLGKTDRLNNFRDMEDKTKSLYDQFEICAPFTWRETFTSKYSGVTLTGTYFYHARVMLTELRSRNVVHHTPTLNQECINPAIICNDATIDRKIQEQIRHTYVKWKIMPVIASTTECDYRHYILRNVGMNTTAQQKVIHILKKWSEALDVESALCVAEGSGGILAAIGLIWPQAILFFNSLKMGVENDQRTDEYFPSEVMSLNPEARESVKSRTVVLDGGTPLSTDLTQNSCIELIEKKVPNNLTLLTCDVEQFDGMQLVVLWRNVLWLLVSRVAANGRVLFKLSHTKGTIWRYVCAWIRVLCTNITMHASPLSGSSNGEFYVTGARRELSTDKLLTIEALLMSFHYPLNILSELEMAIKEDLIRISEQADAARHNMLMHTQQEPTVTLGGSICMSLGFRYSSLIVRQTYLGWLGTDDRKGIAWKHIKNETKHDLRGNRLKAYGDTKDAKIRSEIKEEFRRSQVELLISTDLRHRIITRTEIAEITFNNLSDSKKQMCIDKLSKLPLLTHLEMKHIYKSWTVYKINQLTPQDHRTLDLDWTDSEPEDEPWD
ncbi:L protein [Wenling tonguesole paramyxovirus]|uniref:RNA-directed RNA polymerase L n=1 Tax=Wenling tonguesole paramyxovirus TaxID=2116454 RepID=A0A2P1GN33_9MONO|nr:L protein [Wenling tonguesole paramyxovirus]AVM87378.1 L protein [Wenling tonguesole paramyxovirus]